MSKSNFARMKRKLEKTRNERDALAASLNRLHEMAFNGRTTVRDLQDALLEEEYMRDCLRNPID